MRSVALVAVAAPLLHRLSKKNPRPHLPPFSPQGARANIALLGIKTANDLGKVIGAAGIAQNLGALRALATVGIQQGHMKLHCKNLAVQAGAAPDEIAAVVDKVVSSGERITGSACAAALEALRDDKAKASAFDALKV